MKTRVLFALLPTIIVLLLFEGLLRALDLPAYDTCWVAPDDVWIEEPELGFALRPGTKVGPAEVNALGLRGPVLPVAKDPRTFRILFVGDSSCFGLGIPLEDTFVEVATGALAALAPGRRFEYLIGATPGYSSFQSRVLLERLLPYQPDLVVFYVGARNDHDRARNFKDVDYPARFARRRSDWHQIRVLRTFEFLADWVWRMGIRKLLPPGLQERVPPAEFEQNIEAMLEATQRAGARAIVLLPPYSKSLLARKPIIARYQEILRQEAVAHGARVSELQPLFAQHDEASLYQGDRIHPNANGHRLIGAEIARIAKEADIVPGQGTGG